VSDHDDWTEETMADREIEVLVQIAGQDILAGRLWGHRRDAGQSATFTYTPDYLMHRRAYELDPMLPLTEGRQQTPLGWAIFGAFSDCAPDRWGRRLIQRAEQQRAREAKTTERSHGEIDYLLGVRDDMRQGSLRFRDPKSSSYLADEHHGMPHLLQLPELLGAAEHLERDEATATELQTLLRGGSSLGGARPKAHVIDGNGKAAIAKFPSPASDEWEVMRWEAVALQLAREAGVAVPNSTLHTIDGKAVLILERFDRRDEQRIGYVSAMTMLETKDGEQGSYLEIADIIERHSANAGAELRQLWRRIAFSILISNTDDHLRNHGFLRTSTAGWSLSPAFDLNPNPQAGPKYLSTAIDYDSTAARVETLMAVAESFRLNSEDATRELREVQDATSQWRRVAHDQGLQSAAVQEMAPAFEHEQRMIAQRITGSSA
jgi:serine/threonine-protein kinase HipA